MTNDAGSKEEQEPAGARDRTPIPDTPNGCTLPPIFLCLFCLELFLADTVRFTFHRAKNLPMADYAARTSDPYLYAILTTSTPSRHPEGDPPVSLRTPTIHRDVNPEFNVSWTVANIPSDGFKLKIRLYDEDAPDKDDRLGNVHVNVHSVSENWNGIQEESFHIEKRSGSWRAYAVRAAATMLDRHLEMRGQLIVSAELVGRTEGDSGRVYTVAPGAWSQSYSALIGKLANTKDHSDQGTQKFE